MKKIVLNLLIGVGSVCATEFSAIELNTPPLSSSQCAASEQNFDETIAQYSKEYHDHMDDVVLDGLMSHKLSYDENDEASMNAYKQALIADCAKLVIGANLSLAIEKENVLKHLNLANISMSRLNTGLATRDEKKLNYIYSQMIKDGPLKIQEVNKVIESNRSLSAAASKIFDFFSILITTEPSLFSELFRQEDGYLPRFYGCGGGGNFYKFFTDKSCEALINHLSTFEGLTNKFLSHDIDIAKLYPYLETDCRSIELNTSSILGSDVCNIFSDYVFMREYLDTGPNACYACYREHETQKKAEVFLGSSILNDHDKKTLFFYDKTRFIKYLNIISRMNQDFYDFLFKYVNSVKEKNANTEELPYTDEGLILINNSFIPPKGYDYDYDEKYKQLIDEAITSGLQSTEENLPLYDEKIETGEVTKEGLITAVLNDIDRFYAPLAGLMLDEIRPLKESYEGYIQQKEKVEAFAITAEDDEIRARHENGRSLILQNLEEKIEPLKQKINDLEAKMDAHAGVRIKAQSFFETLEKILKDKPEPSSQGFFCSYQHTLLPGLEPIQLNADQNISVFFRDLNTFIQFLDNSYERGNRYFCDISDDDIDSIDFAEVYKKNTSTIYKNHTKEIKTKFCEALTKHFRHLQDKQG